jgi:hypothetical protein
MKKSIIEMTHAGGAPRVPLPGRAAAAAELAAGD